MPAVATRCPPRTSPATSPSRSEGGWQNDPEVQLMLRVQQGDDSVFCELQKRYTSRVFGYFCRQLKDRAEAEDLGASGSQDGRESIVLAVRGFEIGRSRVGERPPLSPDPLRRSVCIFRPLDNDAAKRRDHGVAAVLHHIHSCAPVMAFLAVNALPPLPAGTAGLDTAADHRPWGSGSRVRQSPQR